jgi:GntR family transcriptional repressor for pyruvate dehydrogenase complex
MDRVSTVENRFKNLIFSGELAPDDNLPSERTICIEMGVSRTVVREALGRLESLGMIRRKHGSRTVVVPPDSQQVKIGYERSLRQSAYRLEDLDAVRRPLEMTIASLAATNRTDEHLRRLERAQTIFGSAGRSVETYVRADTEFHAALAEASGNPVFQIVLEPLHGLLIESRRRTLYGDGPGSAYEEHEMVLRAVRERKCEKAASAMAEHLQHFSYHDVVLEPKQDDDDDD